MLLNILQEKNDPGNIINYFPSIYCRVLRTVLGQKIEILGVRPALFSLAYPVVHLGTTHFRPILSSAGTGYIYELQLLVAQARDIRLGAHSRPRSGSGAGWRRESEPYKCRTNWTHP